MQQHYIALKDVPQYCPFGNEWYRNLPDGIDSPMVMARIVGYKYPDGQEGSQDIISLIDGDESRALGERVIDRLLYDGILSTQKGKQKAKDSLGKTIETDIIQYGVLYGLDGKRTRDTIQQPLMSDDSGQYEISLEIHMATLQNNGMTLGRDVIVKKRTPRGFAISFLDYAKTADNDIVSLVCRNERGFKFLRASDQTGECVAIFYDSFGIARTVHFSSLNQLLRSIVSVRVIGVEKIAGRESGDA